MRKVNAMKTIEIKKEALNFFNEEDQQIYTITSSNGSGLYYTKSQEGEEVPFTSSELKKMNVDIFKVDQTLEMISNKETGHVYTDDMLNFISKREFEEMPEQYKGDFEQVNFVIA